MKNKNIINYILAIFLLILSNQSLSGTNAGDVDDSAMCPKADIFGGMIDRVCWDCMLPIDMFGVDDSNTPDGAIGSNDSIGCSCNDPQGVPKFGFSIGYWQPAKLQEVVRVPHCYPALGGARMGGSLNNMGHLGVEKNETDLAFFHTHYYSFPLTVMLEALVSPGCNAEGYMDMDLISISEAFPDWGDDELAFYMAPESAGLSLMTALCAADGIAATAGVPTEKLFFCSGSRFLYPLNGHVSDNKSIPSDTSLVAVRFLAKMHRLGLARKTIGAKAQCGGFIQPFIPKSQYKHSMYYPMAEASGPTCCHSLGADTFSWGEWRSYPYKGEDAIYMLWNFVDCCLN